MDASCAHILIVDDDERIRSLFAEALGLAGFDLTIAGTGAEAMAALESGTIDLVVLDLVLPDTTGFDLLERLRSGQDGGTVPVIVVAGDPKAATRVRLLQAGADDYIVKPVDLDELVARVTSRLRIQTPDGDFAVGARRESRAHVTQLIADRAFHPVYQPIVDVETLTLFGYEALTRFDDGTPPDVMFKLAHSCKLGLDLEAATLGAAIDNAVLLPPTAALSLNVSVGMLLDPRLHSLLDATGDRLLMLELTEHERVDDYETVHRASRRFGPRVQLSVDDTGAGYASLRHVLSLQPDYVKLDRAWVSGIDEDPARQALVMGIVQFVQQLGGTVIAEGVETSDELNTVQRLGAHFGQGWLLGRPQRIDSIVAAAAAAEASSASSGRQRANRGDEAASIAAGDGFSLHVGQAEPIEVLEAS